MQRGFSYMPAGVRITRDQLERTAAVANLSPEAVLARIRQLDSSVEVIEYPEEPFYVACGSEDQIGESVWPECEYCGERICHDPAFPPNAKFVCISCIPLVRKEEEQKEEKRAEGA